MYAGILAGSFRDSSPATRWITSVRRVNLLSLTHCQNTAKVKGVFSAMIRKKSFHSLWLGLLMIIAGKREAA